MHDFRRTVVRNLERAGVPRSVAMKLTGHKTESIYRRYAIVSEADLSAGVEKLAKLYGGETRTTPAQREVVGLRETQSELAYPTGVVTNRLLAWLRQSEDMRLALAA